MMTFSNQKVGIVVTGLLATFFCVFQVAAVAFAAPDEPSELGMRVANSTFIYLANTANLEFDAHRRTYLPGGTRFLIYDKVHNYRGMDWRLILTEDGLWGYIRSTEKPEDYFRPELRQKFIDNDKIAIIQRAGLIDLQLSVDVLVKVTLTRSETYKYVRQTEKGIVVVMSKLNFGPDVNVEAVIPYEKKMVTIFNKTKPLRRKDIQAFRIKSFQGVFGIRKPCGWQRIGKMGATVGGAFDFDLWFVKAKIGGDVGVVKSEILSSDVGLIRTYYGREGATGSYQISEILKCPDQGFSYRYINPMSREIELTPQFESKGFTLDTETQRVLITKPEEYFKMFDILEKRRFEKYEIPFIISRLTDVVPQ
jgi:hypothetical protein